MVVNALRRRRALNVFLTVVTEPPVNSFLIPCGKALICEDFTNCLRENFAVLGTFGPRKIVTDVFGKNSHFQRARSIS
jgi:hypothetical protein